MSEKRKSVFGLVAGGFFVILPVLLAALVITKLFRVLLEWVGPALDAAPGLILQDPVMRFLVVLALLVGLLLLLGLMARTHLGQAFGHRVERRWLKHIPFYSAFQSLVGQMVGVDGAPSLPVAEVAVRPGVRQLGIVVERHADGSATVYLPSVPNPVYGTILLMEASLIHEVPIPSRALFRSFNCWGQGVADLLEEARKVQTKVGEAGK